MSKRMSSIRVQWFLIIAVFLMSICVTAQEEKNETDRDRGTQYLKEVGQKWKNRVPFTKHIGMYVGRLWVGHLAFQVQKAKENKQAFFSVTVTSKFKPLLQSIKMNRSEHVLFTRALKPVKYEISQTTKTKNKKETKEITITVDDGKWEKTVIKKEESQGSSGKMKPATTAFPTVLTMLHPPTRSSCLLSDIEEMNDYTYRKSDEKVNRNIGKEKGRYTEILIQKDKNPKIRLFVDSENRFVEAIGYALGGNRLKFRPIQKSDRGKNLDEPLNITEPQRTFIDLFLGIAESNRKKIKNQIDFRRMAKNMVPNFDSLSDRQKKKARKQFKKNIMENFMSKSMRDNMPDKKYLEDIYAMQSTSNIDGDRATVELKGGGFKWKLYKKENGTWLIYNLNKKK